MKEEMEDKEKALVERELGKLVERTLALEDELNNVIVMRRRN